MNTEDIETINILIEELDKLIPKAGILTITKGAPSRMPARSTYPKCKCNLKAIDCWHVTDRCPSKIYGDTSSTSGLCPLCKACIDAQMEKWKVEHLNVKKEI